MLSLFGAVLGIIFGFATLFVPVFFWPNAAPKLSRQQFTAQYPNKKWVIYVHFGLPIFWLLLYALLSPFLWNTSDKSLYFVTYAIVGGLALGHGILEIVTTVSMRNFRRLGPEAYVVDQSIRYLGWIRLGFVLFLGIIPSLVFAI